MPKLMFALSLGFAAVLLITHGAVAAPQCGLRLQVLDTLAQKYGETRRSMGMAADNTVMELFASAETGTWTLTVTLPTGMTCLVAAGGNFDSIAEELPARGDPA